MRIRNSWRRAILCLALLSLPAAVFGQTASLSGTVRDSSGGVLARVAVKLTDKAKGTSRSMQTDSTGTYQFGLLATGEYEINADLAGFQSFQRGGIVLRVDERQRLDFTLQVGGVTTAVEVTGSATSVQTETALSVGAVIE